MSQRRTDTRPQQIFWAFYAAMYDTIWDSPITAALTQAAAAAVPDDGVVVDLGCGTGLLSHGRRAHVIGVDSSLAMLHRALRRDRITEALHRPAENTGIRTGSAEGVIIGNLLHLHPAPAAVLAEAHRICALGGRVFLCWPTDGPDSATLRKIDIRLNRTRFAAYRADLLRRAVALPGRLVGTRRALEAETYGVVTGFDGFEMIQDATVHDCQRVIVLRHVGAHGDA